MKGPTPGPTLADRGRVHSSLLFFKKSGGADSLSPGEEVELKRQQVIELIGRLKLLSLRRLENEVSWYFGPLGLDKQYFKSTTSDIIAQHIVQLYAAKVDAHVNNAPLKLRMFNESENSVVFALQSSSRTDDEPESQKMGFEGNPETAIEQNWLHEGYHVSDKPRHGIWRVHYYRTNGTIVDADPTHLNFYFLTKTQISTSDVDSYDIRQVGDPDFLKLASQGTLQLYQEAMTGYQKNLQSGVFVKMVQTESHSRLIIAYRRGTVHSFFSGLTALYQGYQLLCPKKRVEQFANGMTIISLYLVSPTASEPLTNSSSPLLPASPSLSFSSSPLITTSETTWRGKCVETELLNKIVSEISLLFVLPRTSLSVLLLPNAGSKKLDKPRKKLSIQEVTYAFVIWKFIYMFLANLSLQKWSKMTSGAESNVHLEKVKERLRQETYTESRVFSALKRNPEIISELYANFSSKHHSQNLNDLKLKSSVVHVSKTDEEIQQLIKEKCANRLDSDIFSLGLLFNQQVVKSNFYKTNKTALAFRLSPRFLTGLYPILPVAVTYLIGSEFRGFHIRFRETGLGQVRIIHSDNYETFSRNASILFEENYSRALIQHRRAKDIAEGGSMGTILLSLERQDKGNVAFKKYINSLLDLEMDTEDFNQKQDWIFIGPSEKTRGELMEWATLHAKARGHPYWRSFATGKSVRLGGFPQETFVMATVSTRQYVLGIIKKFSLKEEDCTKVQISGPSHRLGASEITGSKDKTLAIVDESGVIYDPKGLNRTELARLVSIKATVSAYDQTKLSAEGFFVDVKDTDKTLPDGTMVYSGRTFTETFHFSKYSSAQFFLPCEGEPNSVNLDNVDQLIDPISGKCRFQFIIEVVSMFFSDEARVFLEKRGAIFVKDSSSNKGSLISASLEVLVGLALTDEEYSQHMVVSSASRPDFHVAFGSDVLKLVEENARLEFECLWREHQNTGVPIIHLSVLIGNKINELKSSIPSSNLWNNHNLRQVVFKLAIPASLLNLIGLETLQKRIPESYMRDLFSAYLASRYVYSFGLSAEAFSFYSFIEDFLKNY